MSSSEENVSESEESCEEAVPPIVSNSIPNRHNISSSSESDDSNDNKTVSSSNSGKNVGESSSDEESDNSATQSDVSAASIKNKFLLLEASDDGDSDSADSEADSVEPSTQADKKLNTTNAVDSSSDDESKSSDSDSSTRSSKQADKTGLSNGVSDSDSENEGSEIHSKKETASVDSSTGSSSEKSDSSEEVDDRKKGGLESDSEENETQEDQLSEENSEKEQPVPQFKFPFSDENLIDYSSAVINLENLSSDNDYWLIHCPQTVSGKDLRKAAINFGSETHLKIGGRKIQATCYREKGTVACVLPSENHKQYFVVGLPVKGSLVFEESIKLPRPVTLERNSEDGVRFPASLKVRHPLFGADYKERLEKSRCSVPPSKKRKSKSKEKSLNSTLGNNSSVNTLEEAGITGKRKKHRVSNDAERSSSSVAEKSQKKEQKKSSNKSQCVDDELPLKNDKKRKRENDSQSNVDLEDSGLHKSFVVESKKRKFEKSKEKSKTPVDCSFNGLKKSRKASDSFSEILLNVKKEKSFCETSVEENTPTKKKKKKKSKEDS